MPTKTNTVDKVGDYGLPAIPAMDEYNKISGNIRDLNTKIALNEPMYPQVTGPTAQSVNQAAAQQQPQTWSEFTARGGIGNTAMQTVNKVRNHMNKKKLEDMYIQLLEAGERGAEAAYNDAVKTYGQEVTNWIPEKSLFYDESGIFLPHKYYQSMALGIKKFKQNELQKQETAQAGQVIGGAATPQEAAAGVMRQGIEPGQFKDVYSTVPTIKDYSAVNKDLAGIDKTNKQIEQIDQEMEMAPTMQQAKIDLLGQKGETEKARQWRLRNYLPSSGGRGGGGPGKPTYSQLASLNRAYTDANQKILNFNKEIGDIQNDRRIRPEEKQLLIQDITEKRIAVERTLPQIENDLNTLREALGYEPVEMQPEETKSEAETITQSIYDEIANQLGKYQVDNRFGRMMAYDQKGRPQSQKYNKAAKQKIENFISVIGLEEASLPGLNLDEDIETKPLEDIIEAIILYKEYMKGQGNQGVYQTPQLQ